MHSKSNPTADCCGADAFCLVVWLDDTRTMLSCRDCFAWVYETAIQENAGLAFLPVHVEIVGVRLVAA